MASTSGSDSNASYESWVRSMPSDAAVARARSALREAIATTCVCVPRCIAGMTFVRAIFAVLRTPQRTFFILDPSVAND